MPDRIDVFVSYKREARPQADRVSKHLRSLGYTVVTDLEVDAAEHFGAAVDRMVRMADIVVVLWDALAARSRWVQDEARLAVELKTYLGVTLQDVDLPVDLRYRQCIDLRESGLGHEGLDLLAAMVTERIGPPKAPDPERSSQELTSELLFFQTVARQGNLTGYRTYLERYPDGALSDIARKEIERNSRWTGRLRRAAPSVGVIGLAVAVAGVYLTYVQTYGNGGLSLFDPAPTGSVGDTPAQPAAPPAPERAEVAGMTLEATEAGLFVRSVNTASNAYRSGIRAADLIVAAGDEEVDTPGELRDIHWLARVQASDDLPLRVMRQGAERRVALRLR